MNLSVYKLTPKREILLIPNLVWRYPRNGVKTPGDFFESRSIFLKIQAFRDFFYSNLFNGLYHFSKYCTYLVLCSSNRREKSLLHTICCIMIGKFIDFCFHFLNCFKHSFNFRKHLKQVIKLNIFYFNSNEHLY